MRVICITGTPGTGKTTLSKKLAKRLDYEYVDVSRLIEKNRLFSGYDRKRKCCIVDTKRLNEFLIQSIIKNSKKSLIIDSHLSHHLPKKYVDLCIVAKCDLKELQRRLKKKGYNKEKIRENLDCEIFDICLNEAKENKHKIRVVYTDRKSDLDKIR